jgi:hypothetical protein
MFWLLRVGVWVELWNDYHVILYWFLGVLAALMLVAWLQGVPARARMMPWTKRRMQRESADRWEQIRAHAAKTKGDPASTDKS